MKIIWHQKLLLIIRQRNISHIHINYNEFINQPRNFQNKNESLEKKYIKDPEGNLIETYVKKTKYNDGSVLLEYV